MPNWSQLQHVGVSLPQREARQFNVSAIALFLILLLSFSGGALANGVVLRAGYENGGDTIATAEFDDGESEQIRAGGAGFIEFGLNRQFYKSKQFSLETELMLGYKTASINAANGDITFRRYTLNLVQLIRIAPLRFGLGVTYHINPRLKFNSDINNAEIEVDNALGFFAVMDISWRKVNSVGLRATQLNYTGRGDSQSNANSVGIYFSHVF